MNKIFKDTGILLFEKAVILPLSLISSMLVARSLGPESFGLISFILGTSVLLIPFIQVGLVSILTREIVKFPNKIGTIMGSSLIIRMASGLTFSALFYIGLSLFSSINSTTLYLFLLVLSFQLFESLNVVSHWFEAQEKFSSIAFFRLILRGSFIVAKITLALNEVSPEIFIYLYCLECLIINLGLLSLYQINSKAKWKIDKKKSVELIKGGSVLFLSGIAAVIYLKIDIFMIGLLSGKSEVAYYSIAATISEAIYFLPVAIVTAAFPKMIRIRENSRLYLEYLQIGFFVLFWVSFCGSIFFNIISEKLILTIYGKEFISSSDILSIHIWSSVFVFMRALLSKWILTENLLYVSLVTQLSGALVNITLNYFLIPTYGGMGAAYATLLSYFSATIISLFFMRSTFQLGMLMLLSPIRGLPLFLKMIRVTHA